MIFFAIKRGITAEKQKTDKMGCNNYRQLWRSAVRDPEKERIEKGGGFKESC